MAVFETAGQLVNDAAVELGLIGGDLADPYGVTTDPNIVQLCRLLKSAGRELLRERDWTYLQKTYTLTTILNQTVYPLPSDFLKMIDQTGWSRTTRLPLAGPASAVDWEFLSAWVTSITTRLVFRFTNNQLWLFAGSQVPAGQLVAFEYASRWWVQPTGQTAPTAEAPTASTDTIWFESFIMVKALKLAFLKAKGLDTAAAQDDYDRALSQVVGNDAPAPTLSIGQTGGVPLIGAANIPVTGIGS